MTKRKVTFYNFNNKQQKEIIKTLWGKYSCIVPPWILRVSFKFVAVDDENQVANVLMDLEYLNIKITLFPRFFSQDEKDMEHAFVHEIAHIYVGDLTNWFGNTIDLFKNEETKEVLREELRVKMERTVEWLAYTLKK